MLQDPYKSLDLSQPRRWSEVLRSALWLYWNWPLLFVTLSAVVIVPFELVVLAITGTSPLGEAHSTSTELIVGLAETALVVPLISALQAHAVVAIGDAHSPGLGDVFGRSLRVLPVVVAAQIIAGIGEAIGVVLFIIPGIYLALRWAVVAQVAAIEETDWPTALRRSGELARRNYWRIFGLLVISGLVEAVVTSIGSAVAGRDAGAAAVAIGIVLVVLARTFGALVITVLYFDLRARETISA
jgi:hypothetical protein